MNSDSAKVMFRDQVHYLNLIQDNGEWKIVSNFIQPKISHG